MIATIRRKCTLAVIDLAIICTRNEPCAVLAVPLHTSSFVVFKGRPVARFAIIDDIIAAVRGKCTIAVIDLTIACTGYISRAVFTVPLCTLRFVIFKVRSVTCFGVVYNMIAAIGGKCTIAVIDLAITCARDIPCTVLAVPLHTSSFVVFKGRPVARFAIIDDIIAAVRGKCTIAVIDLAITCTNYIS